MSKPLVHVLGPREAGPGERREMLERARRLLAQAGVTEMARVDVPAGTGGEEGAEMRSVMESVIPALQSGSLFGGLVGLVLVDAQNLQSAEAEVLAELLDRLDTETVMLVIVSSGALPAALGRVVRRAGDVIEVKKLRERDAAEWLKAEGRARRIRLAPEAAEALLQRFGSDVAGMSQALDQLASVPQPLTREEVLERFRNRPDEPMWHYADAVAAGDTGQALRRLSDFMAHGHPLQLLAFVENDLRRRALAAAAPDLETFAGWVGSPVQHWSVQKAWRQRARSTDVQLRSALDALARADAVLKSAPEETHRPTLERLTVALCRWYGGQARRAS